MGNSSFTTTPHRILSPANNQTASGKRPRINWSPLFGFDVFISYKRQESSIYAGSLERQLRERDLHCFVDDKEIPAGSPLADTVHFALRRSRVLVVVVSPDSLQSRYVQDEVRTFRERSRRIIPVCFSSVKPALMETPANASAPEWVVKQLLQGEVVWIDERENISGADLASPEVADKIAGYFGFRRANISRRLFLAVLFALISIAAAVASIEAVVAIRQRNIAVSGQLAAQSNLLRAQSSAVETRTLLAVESMRLVPTVEGDQALRESLYLLRKSLFISRTGQPITAVGFSPNGFIGTVSENQIVRVFDSNRLAEVSHWTESGKVFALGFNHDGRVLATGNLGGPSHLVEVSSGKQIAPLPLQNHAKIIAFSENGRWMAMANKAGAISLFELSSGVEALHSLQASGVSVLAFSPDDRWLAAGSNSGTVQIFAINGGKIVSHWSHRGAVDAIAFSPNSREVASGSYDGTARVFETETGKELPRPSPSGWRERVPSAGGEPFSVMSVVRTLAFSSDSRLLATGNGDSTARIFDVATGRELLRLSHGNLVEGVAFSPDARSMATGSLDSTVRIFEVSSGKEIAHLALEGPVHAVAFSADGHRLTALTDTAVRIFDAFDGREAARLPKQNLLTTALFSPDGHWLAVKSYDGQHVELVDALKGLVVSSFPRNDLVAALTLQPLDPEKFKPSDRRLLYSGEEEPFAFSSDARKLAIADDDGVRVFEIATRRELIRVAENEVKAVSFSPDGLWIATANTDGIAKAFESSSGAMAFSSSIPDGLGAMRFSPDSRFVATAGGDRNVHVFEVSGRREVARLQHQDAVEVLAFSPDSRSLATGDAHGTARVLRLSTGEQILNLPTAKRIAAVLFSPDGRWLAIAGEDRLARVIETATGKEVASIMHQAPVLAVLFSADSSSVATASYDYTVRVFEAATGKEKSRINLDGRVKAMKFIEDGRILETASSGKLESEEAISANSDFISLQRHLLRPEDLIQEACSRLTQNLSVEEWKQYWGYSAYHRTCLQFP